MPSKDRLERGQRLKKAAKAVGFTSDTIGERVGKEGGTVRGWWRGYSEPDADTLALYAAACRVSIDYLVAGSERAMGPSGSLAEWRLRFAELIRQGMDPIAAIDKITGPPRTGVEGWALTPEEKELLAGSGPQMREAQEEQSRGQWEQLSDEDRELVLRVMERLARSPPGDAEPG